MDELRFSKNWNGKLHCEAFTTIRKHNPNRYYYGKRFWVSGPNLSFEARVIAVTKCKLDELSEYQSYLDTGLNTEEAMSVFAKMYKDIDDCLFDYILLRKISPQQELFR